MRVRFTGPHLEPVEITIDLEVVPRVGEYVDMGDGFRRHVASIEHKLDCRDMDDDQLVWKLRPKRDDPGRGETSIRDEEPRIHVYLEAGAP